MSRRSYATFIRVRQELLKRAQALVAYPARDCLDRADPYLSPAVQSLVATGTSLHLALTDSPGPGFTLPRPDASRTPLPGAHEIIGEARNIADGRWLLFGRRTGSFEHTGNWLADPYTGSAWPGGYWTRTPYLRPGHDVKHVWELNRHHALVRLAQGYHLTQDESLAERVLGLLDSWIAQNPPRRGVNWTASLEVAFRAIAWCWIWQLTHRSPAWTEVRLSRFLAQLWHHARYVEQFDSVHHSPNTHLTGEALGLLYVGLTFPGLSRSAGWRQLGTSILLDEIEHQFLPDGFHFERATGYHRYHLEFYTHALILLRDTDGFGERVRGPLYEGFRAALALMRPDGSWPLFGDEDGGSTLRLSTAPATDLRPLLALGAALFDDPTLLTGQPSTDGSLAWWLVDEEEWVRLAAMTPEPPTSTSALLPSAGYATARDDWGSEGWYCAVDVGPHGGLSTGHAHTDLGHVEIARGNMQLIVDPGSLSYGGDPADRAWHRSERAHARPEVEGIALAEPSGPFGWRKVSPTPVWESMDDGSCWQCRLHYSYDDGQGNSAMHERLVVFLRGSGVIVCDWLDVADRIVRWHWPVAAPVRSADLAGGHLVGEGLAFHWQVEPAASLPPELTEVALARSYAEPVRGHVLTASSATTSHAVAVACAVSSEIPAPVLEIDGDHIHCTLYTDSVKRTITIERGPIDRGASSSSVAPDSTSTTGIGEST